MKKNRLGVDGRQLYDNLCKVCDADSRRAWRLANVEKSREITRTYSQTPQGRAYKNARNRKRRAVRLSLPHVAYTAQEIYERDAGVCILCGFEVSSEDYHIEHVVPLQVDASLLLSYGITEHPGDVRWNVSVAHPSCNSSKGNRMRQEDAANYALLQYLYKE